LFSIGALSLFDCMLSLLVGTVPLLILEFMKVLKRACRGGGAIQTTSSSAVAHRAMKWQITA